MLSEVRDRLGDPRLDERSFRCIQGHDGSGSILLIGVVHDHPSSVFRVARLVETFRPDILALELPPLAVPLFRMYARDRYTPPQLGGEMSMAIKAAGDVPTVGLDAPNRRYLRVLVGQLSSEDVPFNVVRAVLRDLVLGFLHALACYLGGLIGRMTPLRLRVYSHIEYDCSLLDSPAVQADHEVTHLSQRQAFLRAIRTPQRIRLIDGSRETVMAERLRELRSDGDVVAVVGMEHLDALDAGLRDSA